MQIHARHLEVALLFASVILDLRLVKRILSLSHDPNSLAQDFKVVNDA